jgi:RNA 2',3'-cyclic 3'-phosphodiesterase
VLTGLAATYTQVRLFVAIAPPCAAVAELEAAVDQLRADPARSDDGTPSRGARTELTGDPVRRLRWTSSEQWHLTLAFLGEVDDAVLVKLRPRLARAVSRHSALRLAIAGAGAFPRPHKARVLWAGLRADNRALAALAASVAAAARRAGAPSSDEGRRFTAHLTLARCRDDADLSRFTTALAGFAGQEWTAESVRLIRSHLSAGPPSYVTIGEWPLRRQPD